MPETIKERPILMSGAMVRAILNGTKTQTRRVVDFLKPSADEEYARHVERHQGKSCKYGTTGDRLWVRETWNRAERTGYDAAPQDGRSGFDESDPDAYNFGPCWFRATDERLVEGPWRPSIFMPRAASRLTLEVVSVRVERLQDISEEDAIAEGIERIGAEHDGLYESPKWRDYTAEGCYLDPRESYESLWEKINGAGSWESNPWVWVVEFKKLEAFHA